MKIGKNKYLLFILILLISSAYNCNKFTYRMIYDNFDFILYLNVNKYFIPDEKQKDFVKQKLTALLKWNRETALPRYRELFIYMKNTIKKGVTEENIQYVYEVFDQEIGNIAEKAAPEAADFLLTLNEKQIENYRKVSINHKNEEQKKLTEESKDPLERRTKSAVRFLSRIYGSFSPEQTEKIKDFIQNSNTPENNRWEVQDIKRDEFIELLHKKAGKETISEFLRSWMLWKDSPPGQYKEIIQAERKFNMDIFLFVDKNIVTEKQRENAADAFDNWIETIDVLINEKNIDDIQK